MLTCHGLGPGSSTECENSQAPVGSLLVVYIRSDSVNGQYGFMWLIKALPVAVLGRLGALAAPKSAPKCKKLSCVAIALTMIGR
ncbi:predicted protein [Sclerotinia sclerotiorum 1980 UF-70]|uniref:Uncharacterized protein n=2 Tax=Sclerotinia sclerotiorum (strain ATCC 18683 / 1980 / Ss-1) TaxID=665079 RepID=A7ECW6_SCLS1|nr:predicted protein [Sclerotinia sclerotiorum 1980 UF-70]APA11102.1 hypothetical protein sscle_07g058720 [Sclerotinia sclerotiorum 1980 UF-70]EDO00682.1 predicted protein [Sclerotinia sclerotiorum 1980 UF-70]